MTITERFKLRFGPYATPRFRYGKFVWCAMRGKVKIVSLTDAKIPWPVGKTKRAKTLVLYRDLVKAIRRESNQAICHWWGVTPQTVTRWRKALGIDRVTPGTSELFGRFFNSPRGRQAMKKAWEKARDPKRRHKIAEAKRGKKRPRHVIEALRRSHLGVPMSPELRKKLSRIHKRLGTKPDNGTEVWTEREDRLVRRFRPTIVVKRTGRTLTAVYCRRHALRVSQPARRIASQ